MKRWLAAIGVGVVAAACAVGCHTAKIKNYERPLQFRNFLELTLGQSSPDFELKDITGKPWRMSEHRGKLIVLQFVSATSPPFVQSIDDFRREVLSRYLLNPDVLFVYVFSQEAHPELLSSEAKDQLDEGEYVQRLDAAKSYYYRLKFTAKDTYDMSGLIPAAENVVLLVDEIASPVGPIYGYGRGGVVNPTFLVDQSGMLVSKALYSGEYLAPTNYRAGNLATMIQTRLK